MKFIYLYLLLSIFSKNCFAVQEKCFELLAFSVPASFNQEVLDVVGENKDGTSGFIAFFEKQLNDQKIGESELLIFADGLLEHRIVNPILEKDRLTNHESLVAYGVFQDYVDNAEINLEIIRSWVDLKINKLHAEQQKKNEIRVESASPYKKMEFHHIPKGSFIESEIFRFYSSKKSSNEDRVEIKIPNDFAMMSMLVTQYQWVDLLGVNPSFYKKGSNELLINHNNNHIGLQPDNPVENITWWSALEFANRLSIRDGLQPVYELTGVTEQEGNVENGSLVVNDGMLKISNHRNGYRLPTDAEWEFVIRNLGKSETKYPFTNDKKELQNYAWYYINAKNSTHPVGELQPFIINKNKFYDMFGNVKQWTGSRSKAYAFSLDVLPDGSIQFDISSDLTALQRGFSIDDDTELFDYDKNYPEYCSSQKLTNGFRLVKTVTAEGK